MALIEKVSLFYREGTSDKVYEIHLTEEDDGFRVIGFNGRRGTKLVEQPKTPRPVPYRTARYIFDNLEAAKLNHRKTPYSVGSRETKLVAETRGVGKFQQTDTAEPELSSYNATRLDALEF